VNRLALHLAEWLGAWPPLSGELTIVASAKRAAPGWDGAVHDCVGVTTPKGGVLSLPPGAAEIAAPLVAGLTAADAVRLLGTSRILPDALGRDGRFGQWFFRWSEAPTPFPDAGEWVPVGDPRVPEWLRPFNDEVLIAWDPAGAYGAGVGLKKHDRHGHEISVGTEPALRGQGIARRLVATAARKVLADGAVPTYLHDPSNHASASVAEASGFPDHGWRILGFW
jgi:GNAT superfamily N-acetyltransferase